VIDKAEKKKRIIEYFEQVPIQKYAAESVGIDEDTLTNWKKEDTDFSDALLEARSVFLKKKIQKSRPEFSAERLFPELREQKKVELSGEVSYQPQDIEDGVREWLKDPTNREKAREWLQD
jgi:hypothetical protein